MLRTLCNSIVTDNIGWQVAVSMFARHVQQGVLGQLDIATDIPLAWRIAVSDKCVYWTDANGVIMYVSR
jgi:hypothetical protein